MPAHKTVELQLGRGKVAIDELLAPLLRLVWARGIRTLACCQEPWPGWPMAWVVFTRAEDAQRFLDLVGRDLYQEEVDGHPHLLIPHQDLDHLVEALHRATTSV